MARCRLIRYLAGMEIAPAHRTDRPQQLGDRGYIPTLDGWRAIAVMLVIGAHCVGMLHNNGSAAAVMAARFFSHAGYGVDIFFALSGFLITSLLLAEREKSGRIDLGRFYIRRFFRIIPPMAVYLVVIASLAGLRVLPHVGPSEIVGSFLFARNYIAGSWYTGHFWSLSIEEHFYAFVPILIVLLRPKALLIVSIAIILACIGVRAFELAHAAWFQPFPQFRTENRVDSLLWGSVLAQLCRRADWSAALRRMLTPWLTLGLAVLVVALLSGIEAQSFRRTLTSMVLPILIASTVLRPATTLGKLLELDAVRYLGRLSYSLYVWQMMFLVPMSRPLGLIQSFPLALILAFIMAYLSYRFVEQPCIRIGRGMSSRRRAAAPPPLLPQAVHTLG